MFQPSKQLQAWTLLVQDGSLDSLSGAEKIEDAISAELRAAWASGELIPNGSSFTPMTKPGGLTEMEVLRKEWAIQHPVDQEDCTSCSTVTEVKNDPPSIRLTVMPPVTIADAADMPRAPIDRMETISPELAELAQAAQKTRVPVLTPAPEIKMVKEETPGLIAVGKSIPPFYKGPSQMVNAVLVRERLKKLADSLDLTRNQMIITHMKFKTSGALGNLLSTKHDTIETCFAQYLAEVLGQDILIP